MLVAENLRHVEHFAGFQLRQFALAFLVFIVDAFHVNRDKAGEYHGLAGCAEQIGIVADGKVDADRIESGLCHLAGQRPLPDHFVKPELFVSEKSAHVGWCAADIGGTYRLVRFLRVLRLGFVHDGRLGQIVGFEILLDVIANLHHRFRRQTERIGTHVGDETNGAAADIHTFIQLLGDAHRTAGGEPQLAHSLLLQRGGGERRGRAAAFLFFLDPGNRCFSGAGNQQSADDLLLLIMVGDAELLDLLVIQQHQPGTEDILVLA